VNLPSQFKQALFIGDVLSVYAAEIVARLRQTTLSIHARSRSTQQRNPSDVETVKGDRSDPSPNVRQCPDTRQGRRPVPISYTAQAPVPDRSV